MGGIGYVQRQVLRQATAASTQPHYATRKSRGTLTSRLFSFGARHTTEFTHLEIAWDVRLLPDRVMQ